MNSVKTGIVSNDHNGFSGRGTRYFMDVTLNGETTRHEWDLMDEIEKKVNPEDWSREAYVRINEAAEGRKQSELKVKADELANREFSLVIDPMLATLVKAVVDDESSIKAIGEFNNGKEKALNSLVGSVIKLIRSQRMTVNFDAFAINRALQRALTQ